MTIHSRISEIPILTVDNLHISFLNDGVEVTAVNGVSFKLNKGETLGIVGESGSGKSVCSMSILKLLPTPPGKYSGGHIWFGDDHVDLLGLSEEAIRPFRGGKVSMIFQEPMTALNPSQRCGRQVAEMLALHTSWDKAKIKAYVLELFQKVKLPDPDRAWSSYPHQLSGGQLQRVMIAMAISCKPAILIADEPTTALDVTVQKVILELLKDLNKENGNSTIFITHDLGVIRQIADKVLVIYKGEVMEYAPAKEIFDNPQHPYTKGLIACRPPMDRRLKRLPMVGDFLNNDSLNHVEYVDSLVQSKDEFYQQLERLDGNEVILKVENLKKYYPTELDFFGRPKAFVKAVDDVSFVLRKGETIGLVGESGCGKSTLGKVLMRLEDASAGKAYFQGVDIFELSKEPLRKLRKDFQIIFQDPYSSLNPRMKIGHAIQEPMTIHNIHLGARERKEKVVELLEKVGLQADHYGRYPHQFSGGQRQRVCIARALGMQPKFIICDESVSALDVSVQAQVLNLLQDLKEEYGLSYLFISHDLSVIRFISDNVMVMEKGRIVETGNAEEVILNPQHEYTKKLIASIPV